MSDKNLIQRLRETASKGVSVWGDLLIEAANEIERMQQERERLLVCSEDPVFLVATGEHCDAKETYTRHEVSPPPLCEFEGPLYPSDALAAARLRGAKDVRDGILNMTLPELAKEDWIRSLSKPKLLGEQVNQQLLEALKALTDKGRLPPTGIAFSRARAAIAAAEGKL